MTMSDRIRARWLRGMYLYTTAGSGTTGVCLLLFPEFWAQYLHLPPADSLVLGVLASVYLAEGLVAVLGLRHPFRFAPLLVVQMLYKTLFLATVGIPQWLQGHVGIWDQALMAIFVTYIVGDVIAIPFRRLLTAHPEPTS